MQIVVQIITILLAAPAIPLLYVTYRATRTGATATKEGNLTQQLQALTDAASLALSIRERENAELRVRLAEQDREIIRLSRQVSRLEHKIAELEKVV